MPDLKLEQYEAILERLLKDSAYDDSGIRNQYIKYYHEKIVYLRGNV